MKRITIILLTLIVACKSDHDTGDRLPNVLDVIKPKTEQQEYIVIDGDTMVVPTGYSKTITELQRLTTLTDTDDFVTIHPPNNTGVWKKFTAAVLKAYVTAALSDSITQHRTEIDGLAAAGVPDGDKGDITVSGSGLVWTIDAGTVGADELVSTAVTPGSYTHTSITVDSDGRITTASSGTDNDTQLTQEQVEDYVGALIRDLGPITVTYDDAGDSLLISSVFSPGLTSHAVSGATHTIDLGSYRDGIHQIDCTSASSPLTLTINNQIDQGVYTFHALNTSSTDIVYPANFFFMAGGGLVGTVSYAQDDGMTCYYDAANNKYYCK